MKCPHCTVEFHDNTDVFSLGNDIEGRWHLLSKKCPACCKLILYLYKRKTEDAEEKIPDPNKLTIEVTPLSATGRRLASKLGEVLPEDTILVRPKSSSRPPCPPEVPKEIAEDYTEACLTLADSPKASAALSRRCLQHLLRDPNTANAQQKELANQIDYVLNSKTLPSYIANDIDAIRNIGNFAAHPTKSQATEAIARR